MAVNWSELGVLFTGVNILNMGAELLPIAFSLFMAFKVSNNKKDIGLAFILLYLLTFILGWAKQIWILIVVGLIVGFQKLRNTDA